MKKIKAIKLSTLSNDYLHQREMNKLLGGNTCCICHCYGNNTTLDVGNALHKGGGIADEGGYAAGSFN